MSKQEKALNDLKLTISELQKLLAIRKKTLKQQWHIGSILNSFKVSCVPYGGWKYFLKEIKLLPGPAIRYMKLASEYSKDDLAEIGSAEMALKKTSPYYVYLMGNGTSYKIGISTNPLHRIIRVRRETEDDKMEIIDKFKIRDKKEALDIEYKLKYQLRKEAIVVGREYFTSKAISAFEHEKKAAYDKAHGSMTDDEAKEFERSMFGTTKEEWLESLYGPSGHEGPHEGK